MAQNFQVDLRGIVDLLARHLYSSPRVYIRELLQNGVDAITARRMIDPSTPATFRIKHNEDGSVEFTDSGIGLTGAQAEELLATIGRSSKRDLEMGTGRDEFLGQFGIGLLSAFMVANEIEMISKSAAEPHAPAVRWQGFADGSYELTELGAKESEALAPGSTVRLRPRRDLEHWLERETVISLVEEYGSLLPIDVRIAIPTEGYGDGVVWRRLTHDTLPWQVEYPSTTERRVALLAYGREIFGFDPLDVIDLDVPLLETSGVAFVLPTAVAPTGQSAHRVYLKRMLLGTRVDDVLPDWAFFVRCVMDTSMLRPTASREALYEDDMLLAARDALGAQVKDWMRATLTDDSMRSEQFISVHHLAVRAIALHDDEMLDLAAEVLPFESTDGPMTLKSFAEKFDGIPFTPTVEEYRRVAPVARAQGLGIVNAGYVYDADLLARVASRHPEWSVRPLQSEDVDRTLALIDELEERRLSGVIGSLNEVLSPVDCEVALRSFEPMDLPTLLIHDRDGDHQRDLARTVEAADDLWGEVLSGFAKKAQPRRLVFNYANDMVRQLLETDNPPVRAAGAESLYVTALLLAQEPLRGKDIELMNRSLTTLLSRALESDPPDDAA